MSWPYLWHWRKRLPDRKGKRCRIIARGKMNTVLLEFEDGYRVATSANGIRKAEKPG